MGVQREGGGWWSYSGVRRGWVVVERTKREKDIALGYFHENESPSRRSVQEIVAKWRRRWLELFPVASQVS